MTIIPTIRLCNIVAYALLVVNSLYLIVDTYVPNGDGTLQKAAIADNEGTLSEMPSNINLHIPEAYTE